MRTSPAYDERLVQPHLLPLGAHLRDLLSQACQVVLGLTGQSVLLAHSPDTLEFIRLRNTYLDPLHRLQAELLARSRNREAALDSPLEQACWCPWRYCRRVAQYRLRACPGHALASAVQARHRTGGWLRRAQPPVAEPCAALSATLGRLSGCGAVYLEQPLTDFGHDPIFRIGPEPNPLIFIKNLRSTSMRVFCWELPGPVKVLRQSSSPKSSAFPRSPPATCCVLRSRPAPSWAWKPRASWMPAAWSPMT
jgi:hypothetical protein